MSACSAILTPADLSPYCKISPQQSGVSVDDVGDSFPGLIRNWPQAPSHLEEWEEGK